MGRHTPPAVNQGRGSTGNSVCPLTSHQSPSLAESVCIPAGGKPMRQSLQVTLPQAQSGWRGVERGRQTENTQHSQIGQSSVRTESRICQSAPGPPDLSPPGGLGLCSGPTPFPAIPATRLGWRSFQGNNIVLNLLFTSSYTHLKLVWGFLRILTTHRRRDKE